MLHLVKIKHHADEIGAMEYLYGPLPQQPIADRVALGRRMLLASIESASLKIVLTTVPGNVDAPAIINYMRTNMLDGRDVQEVLHSMLDNQTIDITTQPLATFLGDFLLIAAELQPPMPARTQCMKYASKFPPELISIGTVCDSNPGFANFMAYALAYNQRANVYIQRMQMSQRNRPTTLPGMSTTLQADPFAGSGWEDHPSRAGTHGAPRPIVPSDTQNLFDAMAANRITSGAMSAPTTDSVAALVTMFLNLDPHHRELALAAMQNTGARSGPNFNFPQNVCINCGDPGHFARNCPKPLADCGHPICASKNLHHLEKFCAYYHPTLCKNEALARRMKSETEEWVRKNGPIPPPRQSSQRSSHFADAGYDDDFFAFAAECSTCIDLSSNVTGIQILQMTLTEFSKLLLHVMLKFAACYATRASLTYVTVFDITMEALIRFAGHDTHPITDSVRPYALRVICSSDAISRSMVVLFGLVTTAPDDWCASNKLVDVMTRVLSAETRRLPLRWYESPGATDEIVAITGVAGTVELLAPCPVIPTDHSLSATLASFRQVTRDLLSPFNLEDTRESFRRASAMAIQAVVRGWSTRRMTFSPASCASPISSDVLVFLTPESSPGKIRPKCPCTMGSPGGENDASIPCLARCDTTIDVDGVRTYVHSRCYPTCGCTCDG